MILIIKEKPFINVISVLKRENNKICVQEGKSFRTMMFIQWFYFLIFFNFNYKFNQICNINFTNISI